MHKQGKRNEESLALRSNAGVFLKALRTQTQLTQRDVAEALGLRYYTMISQIESGAARVPPEQYAAYAKTLGVDPALFVRKLTQYYDPHTYRALFGNELLSLSDFT